MPVKGTRMNSTKTKFTWRASSLHCTRPQTDRRTLNACAAFTPSTEVYCQVASDWNMPFPFQLGSPKYGTALNQNAGTPPLGTRPSDLHYLEVAQHCPTGLRLLGRAALRSQTLKKRDCQCKTTTSYVTSPFL